MEEGENFNGDGGSRCDEKESTWKAFSGAFRAYTPAMTPDSSRKLRVFVRRPLVLRLTKDIVGTFQLCNSNFKYSDRLNPKRFLTSPSVGLLNDGYDNANSDLILHVNSVLVNAATSQRYFVKDVLGHGTFGQVVKCWVPENDSYVAVKIIKNHTAYYRQALVEVSILTMLNEKPSHDEKHHIVSILDYFMYQRHLCISFEMLGSNLFELIKVNQYRGLPLSLVQVFSKQILHALAVIKENGIIHCDLKPENILLSKRAKPEIKVIDFGSACRVGHTVYSYIQSRYYRSPEVLLGYPYTAAIDMWSFGCIVAELFLGLPLFAGASEYDLLKRMIETLGGQPPDDLLRNAKDTNKFFKHVASIYHLEDNQACKGIASAYQILTEDEYEARASQKPIIGKHYFSQVKLEDIITSNSYKKNLSEDDISKEKVSRLALVDFLRGLVEFDPGKRWSPLQASRHPFVTGEPFLDAYAPFPESPQIPVMHSVTVDHKPGGGHWLAAGLSPQVSSSSRYFPHNRHIHAVRLSHGSSFGSMGSHGSYNDHTGLGNSFGSYGDVNSMYSYFSPVGPRGLNVQTPVRGPFISANPDAKRRSHMSYENGFGASPTGSLGPMSLGASPSQFTPISRVQVSTISAGNYGPASPARGSLHGSPLGTTAVAGQYNQNNSRSWGYQGMSMQHHQNASQHWQGHCNDGFSCQSDAFARGYVGSPHTNHSVSNHSNWGPQIGPSSNYQGSSTLSAFNTNTFSPRSAEASHDMLESNSSVPDPADWDPDYSDELLLQEDNYNLSSLAAGINNTLYLGNATDASISSEVGNSVYGHNQARTSSNFASSNQRVDESSQVYALAEGSPHFANNMHAGDSRLPLYSSDTVSRFGQQSSYHHNRHSTYMHGELIHHKSQPACSDFAEPDLHLDEERMFSSSKSRGRRGGDPTSKTRPSSHARKDYERMR